MPAMRRDRPQAVSPTSSDRLEETIDRLVRHTHPLLACVGELRELLADGAGAEHPGELTPSQSSRISDALSAIAAAGWRLLEDDLERTSRREARLVGRRRVD